jgi:hypothetical protein
MSLLLLQLFTVDSLVSLVRCNEVARLVRFLSGLMFGCSEVHLKKTLDSLFRRVFGDERLLHPSSPCVAFIGEEETNWVGFSFFEERLLLRLMLLILFTFLSDSNTSINSHEIYLQIGRNLSSLSLSLSL